MADGKTPDSLKDQLEANAAALQARFDARPQGSIGNDWFHLSEAEEEVFEIDRDRFPRMITTHEGYMAFKLLTDAPHWDEKLIQQERQRHPGWCGKPMDKQEFDQFAKAFGGLIDREVDAIWSKMHFWEVREGVVTYHDGS